MKINVNDKKAKLALAILDDNTGKRIQHPLNMLSTMYPTWIGL
jgi:hypothetical protein